MQSGQTTNILMRGLSALTGVESRNTGTTTGIKSGFLPFLFGGTATTEAGRNVSISSALKLSAVYCAVEVLSNAIAVLPVSVEKRSGSSRETLENHPLNDILNKQVNSFLTSFQFRKIMMRSLLLRGNAFALIIRNEQSGGLDRLQYIDESLVTVRYDRESDQVVYHYRGQTLGPQDLIHLKINSYNGVVGRSIIHYAADSLGVSISALEFGASAYTAKGLTMGVIESDFQDIDPENKVALAEGFRKQMSIQDPHRVAVLDEGMKYKKITLTPQEAQFIEAYSNGIEDIARWFNVPPHKLMHLTDSNFSNIYQMDLSFLMGGVQPYVIDFENELSFKLLSLRESETNHTINLDETAMLRMDPKMRGEYLRAMVLSGIMPQNEARIEAGLNPLKGEGYDDLLTPVNVQGQAQIEKSLKDE